MRSVFCKRAGGIGRIDMFSINVVFKGGRDGGSRGKAEGGGTVADIQDPPPEVKVRGRGGEAGGGHGGQGDQDDQGRQGGQSGHCGQSAQEIEMMEKDDYQAYLQNCESSAVICNAMRCDTDSFSCGFE